MGTVPPLSHSEFHAGHELMSATLTAGDSHELSATAHRPVRRPACAAASHAPCERSRHRHSHTPCHTHAAHRSLSICQRLSPRHGPRCSLLRCCVRNKKCERRAWGQTWATSPSLRSRLVKDALQCICPRAAFSHKWKARIMRVVALRSVQRPLSQVAFKL